jgi:hypothetical protein
MAALMKESSLLLRLNLESIRLQTSDDNGLNYFAIGNHSPFFLEYYLPPIQEKYYC